ncbi:MAG: biotin transporter BioY [Clostridia bacterium]|nr:biotin transporter BioY [Clostridia bacterium]
MKAFSGRAAVQIGAFAAILAVCSQLAIPLPAGVPMTLQTFAVALCGFLLGRVRAPLAAGVYLLLGAVGLPVFSSFQGGVQTLFGPTGGFLFGFVPMAALCGIGGKSMGKHLLFGLLGVVICHAMGAAQYALITQTPFSSACLLVSAPYLLKDVLSLAFALFPARRLSGTPVFS